MTMESDIERLEYEVEALRVENARLQTALTAAVNRLVDIAWNEKP